MLTECILVILFIFFYLLACLGLFHQSLKSHQVRLLFTDLKDSKLDYDRIEILVDLLNQGMQNEMNGEGKISLSDLKKFSDNFARLAAHPEIENVTGLDKKWFDALSETTGQMSEAKSLYYQNKVKDHELRWKYVEKYKMLSKVCRHLLNNPKKAINEEKSNKEDAQDSLQSP